MVDDLFKMPGTDPRRRLGRPRRRAPRRPDDLPGYRPATLHDPRGAIGSDRQLLPRPLLNVAPADLLIVVGFVAVAAFLLWEGWQATRVPVKLSGVNDGAALLIDEAKHLDVTVTIGRDSSVSGAVFTVNGLVPGDSVLEHTDEGFRWRPPALGEGRYELALTAPRPVLSDANFSWTFEVDGTPPAFDLISPTPAAAICEPVTVTGAVEPGTELTADGVPVELDDGAFTLEYDRPPSRPVQLVAVDRAGNTSGAEVVVPTEYPAVQGVHVTAAAWNHPGLRSDVLELIDRGLVSAVELDLKDEGGVVGYDTQVALAHEVGAVRPLYDLDEAVATLEAKGVRVIGRVVAFRDEPLATWAWTHGRPEMVVQTADGEQLGAYGGFTNLADPTVQQYNLDIALEGVAAGMDDILWDYVRRPEGPIDSIVFPGLEGRPEDGVINFLSFTGAALREKCAFQGASVFGIAADRPWAVGQDVGRIARHVDYVAPMLYPSHWVKGEYGIDDPNRQPYDIIKATLADFQAKADGSGVTMVPWIQDFSLGHTYGPDEVRAQIDAAADLGVHNWLLWNASVRYTTGALDPSLLEAPD